VLFREARRLGAAGLLSAAIDAHRVLHELAHNQLDPDHHDTFATHNNLAYSRGAAGEPASAATAFAELLTDRLRVLGPDHPHTLTTRSKLTYWRQAVKRPGR
jgi:hypothetical protein